MKYKVTIGIPVYNSEEYIEKSILSALNQDFKDFEILLIDDCGNDQSMTIVKTIKSSDYNGAAIRIISHPQNLGVSEARNTIIKYARGKYIYFLDSDDYIEPNTIKELYETAELNNSEATYGSSYICRDGKTSVFFQYENRLFTMKDEFAFYAYSSIKTKIQTSVWNILLLTSHLRENHLSFPNMNIGEDFFFTDELLGTLKRVATTNLLTYHYIIREKSLSNYQLRDNINYNEVHNSLNRAFLLIDRCKASKNSPYFPNKCIYIMRQNLYVVFGIIKHRHRLTKPISNKEICDVIKHPATLLQIAFFKEKKILNIGLFILSKLPVFLKISIATFFGKKKGYIK